MEETTAERASQQLLTPRPSSRSVRPPRESSWWMSTAWKRYPRRDPGGAAVRAERIHPHRAGRRGDARHAQGGDGPGHLHLHGDAVGRGTRSRPVAGSARACAAKRWLYAEPLLGVQETGASTSVRGNWEPLRRAGATARTMLVAAASQTWKVEPQSCHAVNGTVTHPARAEA